MDQLISSIWKQVGHNPGPTNSLSPSSPSPRVQTPRAETAPPGKASRVGGGGATGARPTPAKTIVGGAIGAVIGATVIGADGAGATGGLTVMFGDDVLSFSSCCCCCCCCRRGCRSDSASPLGSVLFSSSSFSSGLSA